MPTAFASEAAHIQEIGKLSTADIARATGADETTVRAWIRDERSPSGKRAERLAELSSLIERLVRVMKPEYVPVWMRKPIPLLDDDKPLDLVATGEYRRVSRVIAGLEGTGASQVDVDGTFVSGTWWRHIPAGGDVYYEPNAPADNRWQRGNIVEAWYFADSEDTVWAEWYRALAEAGLPPQQALPRDLWRWEVSLPSVADITDEQRLARLGLPTRLRSTRTEWPTFQPVGEALFAAGWPAIICPSAARPEGRVLCVFRTAREVPGVVPSPPPVQIDEPPVVPTGMTTQCPSTPPRSDTGAQSMTAAVNGGP